MRSASARRSAASRGRARGDQRELVAADAGEAVAGADLGGGVGGQLAQHAVTGRVAEAVVDALEEVDVHEQDGEDGAALDRRG